MAAGGLAGNLSPWQGLETNPPPPVHAPEAGAKRAGRAMLGLKLGLADGLELHCLCLTIGVDFWPPATKTPFGRLGFAE